MGNSKEVVEIRDEDDEHDGKTAEEPVNIVEDEDEPMVIDEATSSSDNARATRAANRRKPAKTTFVKKFATGEQTLRRLLNEATYECDVDPYRGMIRYNQDEESEKNNHVSPWEKSCSSYGTKPDVEDIFNQSQFTSDDDMMSIDEAEPERSTAEDLVFWACRNRCPSLIQWTQQELDKRRRKAGRKNKAAKLSESSAVIGLRPDDFKIRCQCDANPFCLASLGGVMNDIIQRDLNLYLNKSITSGMSRDASAGSSHDDSNDDVVVVEDKLQAYSPTTREALQKIRKTIWVDESRIRAHLENTLQSLSSALSINECLARIRAHHGQLIFEDPLDRTTFLPGQIQLSIPPGIENLGATCYLNTQLQCLAQNTEFLQGILSWKPPQKKEAHDRMTSVLSLFQNLLAEMNSGEASTISTRQFSDSLGLDHFEQQDPNEFSRLFFERMHESLQQGKSSYEEHVDEEAKSSNGDSEHDLTQLLPNLFQGIIRYETTCSHCRNVTSRKEEFMDVNLPIAKPEDRKEKSKSIQQTIMQSFSRSTPKDVDVQFCLDQSRLDELLEGDNRYFCEKCNEKRDANRRVCFQNLPPILNVQLSRYIFDMASLSKKKLSDKVLLSKKLSVEVEEEQSASPERKTYVLCAVMKHQGKSAYSGHYIAEAMDWVTGEWFEFNDEKVTLLKKGPSNSSSGDSNNDGKKPASEASSGLGKSKKAPEGSQDAYNLYYVEESFLAQSVFSFLKKRSMDNSDVLQQMKMKRTESYKELTNLCLEDNETQKRLSKRKDTIMEKLFPPNHFDLYDRKSDGHVWVNGELLRRFLSCSESFENDFRHGTFPEKLLLPINYECTKHDLGIGPREAREGKFLPTPLYETLVKIVLEEEKSYIKNPPTDRYFQEAPSGRISFTSCSACLNVYLESIQQKLAITKSAVELYDALDPREDLELSDDMDDNEPLYVVARKFSTSFRSLVSNLMKRAASADNTEVPDATALDGASCFAGEGLDALLVNSLNLSGDNKDGVDIFVNSLVTCEHRKCKKVTKRNARFVTDSVWSQVVEVFPEAICHPKSKLDIVSNHQEPCPLCDDEDMLTDALSAMLSDLAKEFKKPPRDRKATSDQLLSGATMRLVHADELSAIQKFSNHFKRGNTRFTPETLRAKVEELMCCQEPDHGLMLPLIDGISDESSSAFLLSRFIRPIRCADHSYPIRNAMINNSFSKKNSPSPIKNDDVAIISQEEYNDLILELATVAAIVTRAESEGFNVEETGVLEIKDEGEKLTDQFDMDNYHVKVKVAQITQQGDPFKTFSVPMDSMTIVLQVDGPVCRDAGCSDLFCNWRFKDNPGGKKEVITVDCDSTEIDNSLKIRVVEVDDEASENAIIDAIAQSAGLATMNDSDQAFRRSGRKRKTRTGPVKSEESIQFDFSNNVASLRLCLFERIQNGSQYTPSHQIKLVIWPKMEQPVSSLVVIDDDDDESLSNQDMMKSAPKVINLEFPLNEKNVFELCKDRVLSSLTLRDLEGRIYLIRSERTCPTALELPEEDMMQHLLSVSSAGTSNNGNKGSKGKRKQHETERGFRGTFLSSSVGRIGTPPSETNGDNDVVALPIPGAIGIPAPPVKSALKEPKISSGKHPGSPTNGSEDSANKEPKRARFAGDTKDGSNGSYDKTKVLFDVIDDRKSDTIADRSGLNELAQAATEVSSVNSIDAVDDGGVDLDFASAHAITERLLNHFGLSENDRERCYEAATFALRSEPNLPNNELFNLASAKCFDLGAD